MREQQRHRVRPGSGRVHQVHGDPADLDAQVGQPVKAGLESLRIERSPVRNEAREPVAGHAARPRARIEARQPGHREAPG
jgi:hypothetical protein